MRARECEEGVCEEGKELWKCTKVRDFRGLLYGAMTRVEAKFFMEV